jgi:hypothetical protein
MEFYSAMKKNEILSFLSDGTGEHHLKRRLRRPKIECSPSYADFRPKTNAVILLDMVHTLRGDCA